MAKRLVKIAKELNVGTATIVEHLTNSGFEIENKPTAKVTEEMESELLKEFQKSIAIKEKADQLVIGTRPGGLGRTDFKKETPTSRSDKLFSTPSSREREDVTAKSSPVVPESKETENKQDPAVERPRLKPAFKIFGKIDLSGKKKSPELVEEKEKPAEPAAKPQVEKPEEPKPLEAREEQAEVRPVEENNVEQAPVQKPVEEPVKPVEPVAKEKQEQKQPEESVVEPVVDKRPTDEPASVMTPKVEEENKTKQPAEEAPKAKTPEAVGDQGVVRAEAPELRGLKIQGKIDLDQFKKKKKKKEKKPGIAVSDEKKKPVPSDKDKEKDKEKKEDEGSSRTKRRRKRRKVTAASQEGGGGGGGGRNNTADSNNRPKSGDSRRRGSTATGGTSAGPGRRSRADDQKEVSKKEIDEKIKATMARISGKGKKKRQKMRRDNRERIRERQELKEAEKLTDKLQLTEFVSVQELANLMDVPVTDVIMTCMNLGVIVSINQRLDAEVIELVASEFDHEVEFINIEDQLDEDEEIEDDPEDLEPRAPIVTVMGHVDHGKTSLLDYIRQANVAGGEAGGITQHIGAYEVLVGPDKKKITFLDTPGHEAFTAMRARGAKVTDIAVIIIAADDSIMPQTREAISHAQAANVPLVFAINKIDKPGAQPEKIKQELASMNLLVEDWGGTYQSQDVSAKTGLNVDLLLEKILLEAEVLELEANPDREALGTVIEASLDKGRGYVAKMLVQTGTLHIGDPIVAGEHSGKVKAMFNERGKRIKEAGPSTPVLVLGLSGAPQAGERFKEVENEQEARQIASKRAQIVREQANRATKRISLDEIGRRLALGSFKELNLIVKGDVDGSVEALSDSLIKLSIESVQVNVIHKAVGQIIESDVLLASASDAIIIGFQVRPSIGARRLAEREGVQIKLYSIIYEAIEEIRAAIEGMLEPTKEEKIVAQVAVREVFKISKIGTIAGCFVEEGKITRNTKVRLVRDGIVVYPTREGVQGEIASLRRFKDDVKEVRNGMECGISIKNYNDLKVGDIIEGYEIIEVKRTLD